MFSLHDETRYDGVAFSKKGKKRRQHPETKRKAITFAILLVWHVAWPAHYSLQEPRGKFPFNNPLS
jgi:hypothetical protein